MKACIIQPPYSRDPAQSDSLFEWKLRQLEACDESLDLILLPEYSDVPAATATWEETLACHEKYMPLLLQACRETAVRCGATVFCNALSREEDGWRNTTFALNRRGEVAGKYFKRHLPPLEADVLHLDQSYALDFEPPYILELEGLRFAFATCYDFYFYEATPVLAGAKPDIIIGCSLQRSDTHAAIEIMCRHLAYHTNSYVLRSSVSFDESATVCGASMAVAPTGEVLANLGGKFGSVTVEFDPGEKYFKPAGYGNPPASHHEYMEYGRRPWQYRVGGPSVVPFEGLMPYPRLCAHRGFSAVAPENSLPAFGAAVALGAREMEFDLWPTADGELVSIHDDTLERVSNGSGKVYEHTLARLKALDFGGKFGEGFRGLPIVTFEEILQKFAGQTVMNIHIKPTGESYDPGMLKKIVGLVQKYDCARHCYFMLEKDGDIAQMRALAPDIPVCVGHDPARPWAIVDRAIALGAQKVQFFKPWVTEELVKKAHEKGIICNLFFADDPEEGRQYLDMGIDTILTNDYLKMQNALGIS